MVLVEEVTQRLRGESELHFLKTWNSFSKNLNSLWLSADSLTVMFTLCCIKVSINFDVSVWFWIWGKRYSLSFGLPKHWLMRVIHFCSALVKYWFESIIVMSYFILYFLHCTLCNAWIETIKAFLVRMIIKKKKMRLIKYLLTAITVLCDIEALLLPWDSHQLFLKNCTVDCGKARLFTLYSLFSVDLPWSQKIWQSLQYQCCLCLWWRQHVGANQSLSRRCRNRCCHPCKYYSSNIYIVDTSSHLLNSSKHQLDFTDFVLLICGFTEMRGGREERERERLHYLKYLNNCQNITLFHVSVSFIIFGLIK